MIRTIRKISLAALLTAILLSTIGGPAVCPSWWFTSEQQSDRLFHQEKFAQAAKVSTEPARQGAALYRAGEFKGAAMAFARDGSASGAFNRANALLMQGKYDDAVKSYDRALVLRPNWADAEENRSIAIIRRDRLKTEGGDATGGKVAPDQIVFEKGKNNGTEVQVDAGERMSDEQLRAVWLRRVQTKPADFLRAKFAYQQQDQSTEGTK